MCEAAKGLLADTPDTDPKRWQDTIRILGSDYALAATHEDVAAAITPKTVTLSASKAYDGTTALGIGDVSIGALAGSETLAFTGATASDAHVDPRNVGPLSGLGDALARMRFEGDVWSVPEGTVVFPGETLADHLYAAGPLPELEAVALIRTLADAVRQGFGREVESRARAHDDSLPPPQLAPG